MEKKNKKHLLLRNETGTSLKFNRTRGVDTSEETSVEKDYHFQKDRLRSCFEKFNNERYLRRSKRDQNLEVLHFDALVIRFLKMVDSKFASDLERQFGISAVSYVSSGRVWCSTLTESSVGAVYDLGCFSSYIARGWADIYRTLEMVRPVSK